MDEIHSDLKNDIVKLEVAKPKIKVYSYLAFPLSIIGTQTNVKEWLFSNFINVYSRYDSESNFIENRYDVQFFEDDCYYLNKEAISINTLKILNIPIIKGICSFINEEKYVVMFLDEYYFDFLPNYHNKHTEYEVLIYGYNLKERQFYCLSYGKDQLYKSRVINFEDLESSFTKEMIDAKLPLMLFSFHNESYRTIYKLDVSYIFHMIKNYIDGTDFYADRKKINNIDDNELNVYGINIINNYIKYVLRVIEMNDVEVQKLDLIQFYFFYENKEIMLSRICYLNSKGLVNKFYSEMYEEITYLSRNTLNIAIKYNVRIRSGCNEYNKYLKEILNNLKIIRTKEMNVLSSLISNNS